MERDRPALGEGALDRHANLKAGERLDGVGGFCTYGLIDNATSARCALALPIGLSEDCVLRRDVSKYQMLTFDDVQEPTRDSLIERLWREQNARWPLPEKTPEILPSFRRWCLPYVAWTQARSFNEVLGFEECAVLW